MSTLTHGGALKLAASGEHALATRAGQPGLSIRAKLIIAIALLAGTLFGVAGFDIVTGLDRANHSTQLRREVDLFSASLLPVEAAARDLQVDVIQVQQFLTDASATHDGGSFADAEKYGTSFAGHAATIDHLLAGLEQVGTNDKLMNMRRQLAAVQAGFGPYYALGVSMAHSYIDHGLDAGNAQMAKFDPTADDLFKSVGGLLESTKGLVQVTTESMNARILKEDVQLRTSLRISAALALLGLLVAAAAVHLVIGGVSRPLSAIVMAMRRLTAHDLEFTVPYAGRRDEIGSMADAVEFFRVSAIATGFEHQEREQERDDAARGQETAVRVAQQEAADAATLVVGSIGIGLQRLAAGDLTYRHDGPLPAVYEQLRTDLNTATSQLQDLIRTIAGTSASIRSGVDEVAQASDDMSRRTEQQAATVEQTAAALDMLTGTVRETAEGAGQASVLVASSKQETEQSAEVVRRAIAAMAGIEQSSGEIGQITGIIDEIAFQTNLLALNAGVEAARAGDAGRGFAVVAQEVKKLAQETAAATAKINGSIGALTGEAQAMLARIGSGVDKARSAHEGTREIEALVGSLSTLMLGLSDNSDAVSESIESIVGSISGIRSGLGALSSSSSDNATDLVRLSRQLTSVSDDTNVLLQQMAESGVEIPDSPYIRFARGAADAITARIEADIAAGRIGLEDVLGEDYRRVRGTDPAFYEHPAAHLFVADARPHQEAARALPGFFGMTLTDRNGFAAVAMPERSQPRRADPLWNAEHSRHQQMFVDDVQRDQNATTRPFLLKAYRRPLAGGGVMLLKQVIASIHIGGRHWGISQLAYEDQG